MGQRSHDNGYACCHAGAVDQARFSLNESALPEAALMKHRLIGCGCAGLILLTVVIFASRGLTPSDGTIVQLSNGPFRADRMTLDYVLDPATGLRADDTVTAIDGIPLRSYPPGHPVAKGAELTYTVLSGGADPAVRQVAVRLRDFPVLAFMAEAWPSLIVFSLLLGLATFVFCRRPADPAAQALLLVSSLAFCGATAWLLGDQVWVLAGHGPSVLDFTGELSLALIWGAVAHFALVAPGTHLRVTGYKLAAAYALPLLVYLAYLAFWLPGAHGEVEVWGRVAQVSFAPSTVLPLPTALLMLVSYRATDDAESRRRMRWVLLTLLLAAATFLGVWTLPNALGMAVPPTNLIALLFLPPTLALAAAILRYRLFDVEVILRRSLLYGGLTASLVAIFLAGTWVLARISGSSTLAAVLACGMVGFAAPPLHNFLRRRVGRLVYGERDDPFEVLSRLGRIDAGPNPQLVLQTVADTLAQTLRLPFVAIELHREGSRFSAEASHGLPTALGQVTGRSVTLPLTLSGGVLGQLTLAVGPGREPFGPADRRLLETLGRQVSGAASMVLLTTELQQSRKQIVLAREEERRSLHRRLHDGLGAGLAAGIMRIEVARELIERDSAAAIQHLDEQVALTRSLIGDIRGLVYDLRPPALDQLGLAGALRERASQLSTPGSLPGTKIRVEEHGNLDELPAAVEVAAFWIGVEAVSNAVRHAAAATCVVRLTRAAALSVEVRDDGSGLPAVVRVGGGLISMRERAEELGGTCSVRSAEPAGTVVLATIPIMTGGPG
jgi:two-component system, NarL family, sensor kinase